jgi:hypothetical protein
MDMNKHGYSVLDLNGRVKIKVVPLTFKIWHGGSGELKLPKVSEKHIDRQSMREANAFSGFSNSDLAVNVMQRALDLAIPSGIVYIKDLPPMTDYKANGNMCTITLRFSKWR